MKRASVLILLLLAVGSVLFYLYADASYVYGRVVDATTGRPVVGATVRVGDSSVQTDAAGRYRLEHVRGDFRLLVRAAGYRPWDQRFARGGFWSHGLLANVPLPRNGLSGTVRDGLSGQPVAGATVRIDGATVQADGQGRYRLTRILDHTAVSAQADGYEPSGAVPVGEEHLLRDVAVDITLTPNTLAGVVRDADTGRPIAGATVSRGNGEAASTDEQGGFTLRRVLSGETIRFQARGYYAAEVVFSPHGVSVDVTLTPNTVRGVVRDADTGRPIAGATVGREEEGTVATDEGGSFALRRVLSGETIHFQAQGYHAADATFSGQPQLEVTLRPRVAVVTVHDLFTGHPLAGVTVSGGEQSARTDAGGRAVFSVVEPGQVFRVRASGYVGEEGTYQDEGEVLAFRLRPQALRGTIRDAASGEPLTGALIYIDGAIVAADEQGAYQLHDLPPTPKFAIKASGYRKTTIDFSEAGTVQASGVISPCAPGTGGVACLDFRLTPFEAKGLYIPFGVLSTPRRVHELLDLVERTELNAIVVDVKSDRGLLGYRSQVPLAVELGVEYKSKGRMGLDELIRLCREKNIYTIARLVVFKDNPLALAHPEWAARREDGTVWTDREGLAWTLPFYQEVQDYDIAIAQEVAAFGFDELQFDYIRFPSDGKISEIRYEQADYSMETRTAAIQGFMQRLEEALRPSGVFISADLFGLTVWVAPHKDMGIGQRVQDLAPHVDYLCPMLYPATFGPNNLGYPVPAEHPYDVVYRSQLEAIKRVPPTVKVRPWLQHYSGGGVRYGLKEFQIQKKAAEDARSWGWTFWNSGGKYDPDLFESSPRSSRSPARGRAFPK